MLQKLIKIGSSAAVVIPKKFLDDLGFKIGGKVKVEIDTKIKTVIIESIKNKDRRVSIETLIWIDEFIKKYRPMLEKLSNK